LRSAAVKIATYQDVDPSHTLTIRNTFASEMRKRFRELRGVIWRSIVEEDALALRENPLFTVTTLKTHQMTTAGVRAFDFRTSGEKVEGFMRWLNAQVNAGILEISQIPQLGGAIDQRWTDVYIQSAYQQGIKNARSELRKAGWDVPPISAETGGVSAVFNNPFHADRVGLLYTRTFADLRGITATMENQVGRILAQSMAEGLGPREIARRLNRTISGPMGDLGLTDTLGRFIPAERRAVILARTETIRAHAEAQLQEYENWGAVGVTARVEFRNAGDSRVCQICIDLNGKTFTIQEARGVIPVHPQCLLDGQIRIYTSEGWRHIKDLVVGDMVLTHKARFRKVTQTHRTPKQTPHAVRVYLDGKDNYQKRRLSLTHEHPILINGEWKEAKHVRSGDMVSYFADECARCAKPIPFFRKYCSTSCRSKDIAENQWSDPGHRQNMSEKARAQMHREYASGIRDKDKISRKANDQHRQNIKEGTHWRGERDKFRIARVTNGPEQRKRSSERMKRNNPGQDPEVRARMTASLIETYRKHPDKHPNRVMALKGRRTGIEQKMKDLLDRIGIEYIEQYAVTSPNGGRGRGAHYYVDFAIPALMIAIECDSAYWHQDTERDGIRQDHIESLGWTVIRFDDEKINKCMDEVQDELLRVVGNHEGNFSFLDMEVRKVEHWDVKKSRTLFNLSVDEDESYVANGFVVHNCRCVWIPVDPEAEDEE